MNRRHKNGEWALPTTPSGALNGWEYVPIAVLMDIRDEFQRLNNLLHCHNFVRIPHDYPDHDIDDTDRYEIRCTTCRQDPCECCKECGAGPDQACEPECGLRGFDEEEEPQ